MQIRPDSREHGSAMMCPKLTGPHLTDHTRTNVSVIEKFLPVEFALTEMEDGRWRIAVTT